MNLLENRGLRMKIGMVQPFSLLKKKLKILSNYHHDAGISDKNIGTFFGIVITLFHYQFTYRSMV